VSGEKPVKKSGSGPSDVQIASRGRCKTGAYFGGHIVSLNF